MEEYNRNSQGSKAVGNGTIRRRNFSLYNRFFHSDVIRIMDWIVSDIRVVVLGQSRWYAIPATATLLLLRLLSTFKSVREWYFTWNALSFFRGTVPCSEKNVNAISTAWFCYLNCSASRLPPYRPCWNNPYSIGGGDVDLTLQLVVGFESCLWQTINS